MRTRLEALLDEVLSRRAQALHLGAGYPPLMRRDRELENLSEKPLDAAGVEGLLGVAFSAAEVESFADGNDVELTYRLGDRARFQAHAFHKTSGPAVVFRLLPSAVRPLDELGIPDAVRRVLGRRGGLVLVAGPPGSGRTTTLGGMVDHIGRSLQGRILLVERPLVFSHHLAQAELSAREVGVDVPSYAAALRSARRADVEVVALGELEPGEPTRLALSLAAGGTLVLAGVRARSATAALDRVLASSGEGSAEIRALLAESLVAVVAQRLLQRSDRRGRLAAFEVLLGGPAVSAMIRDGKTHDVPALIQASQALGMQSLDAAIERLVASGSVLPEEGLARASDREGLQKTLARRNLLTPEGREMMARE